MGCHLNITALVLLAKVALANGELTSAQYEGELTSAQHYLQDAKVQIALEQNRIAGLRKQIAVINERKLRFYSESGITEAEVIAAENKLAFLHQQLKALFAVKDSSENADSVLSESFLEIAALKSSRMACLKRISKKIPEIDDLLNTLLSMHQPTYEPQSEIYQKKVDQESVDTARMFYTVKSISGAHETLFSIAKSVYGDPNRWTEIYIANKAAIDSNYQKFERRTNAQKKQIRSSDFILPGQVLIIPVKTAR